MDPAKKKLQYTQVECYTTILFQRFLKKILFTKNKKCLLSIFFKPLDKNVSEIEEMQGNHFKKKKKKLDQIGMEFHKLASFKEYG